MIKDKKTGAVIAENPEEAFWYKVVEETKKDVEGHRTALKFNEWLLKNAEKELKNARICSDKRNKAKS